MVCFELNWGRTTLNRDGEVLGAVFRRRTDRNSQYLDRKR